MAVQQQQQANSNSNSGKQPSIVYVAELETVLNLHFFESLGGLTRGYYQLRIVPTDTKEANIQASTVFCNNRTGYHCRGQGIQIDRASTEIFHLRSCTDKTVLDRTFYLNTTIVLGATEIRRFIHNDFPFGLRIVLYGDPTERDEAVMTPYADVTVRLACMRHKHVSFTNFLFYHHYRSAQLAVTSHCTLMKFYSLSGASDWRHIQGPLVPTMNNGSTSCIDDTALLLMIKMLVYSLNALLKSFDSFILPACVSETDVDYHQDLLLIEDFANLSKRYQAKLESLKLEISKGTHSRKDVELLLEEIPIKIYTLWTKYINRVMNNSDAIFKISCKSRELVRSFYTSTLFTTKSNLNTDMLKCSENKKLFKQIRNSHILNHLFWLPLHQVNDDVFITSENKDGKLTTKAYYPLSNFDLKSPPVATIVIQDECVYKKQQPLDHRRGSDGNLGDSNEELISLTEIKRCQKAKNGSLSPATKNSSKVKQVTQSLNSEEAKVHRHNSLNIGRVDTVYDDLNDRVGPPQYIELERSYKKSSKFDFYPKWFRSLYSVRNSERAHFGLQGIRNKLGYDESIMDISTMKNKEFCDAFQSLLNSSLMQTNFSLARFDPDWFQSTPDAQNPIVYPTSHVVVMIFGLGGSPDDLTSYRTCLRLFNKNVTIISPSRNTDHDLPIEAQASIVMEELAEYLQPLTGDFKISFIAYSLGTLVGRAILEMDTFAPYLDRLHTFMSVSGPHLGIMFGSNLYSFGAWLLKKITNTKCYAQLQLQELKNKRDTFMYKLSLQKNLSKFRNFVILSSSQDQLVPYCSQRIEMCKEAFEHRDLGSVHQAMIENIMTQLMANNVNIYKYDVNYSSNLIKRHHSPLVPGRAAHMAMLDNQNVIRFMLMGGCKFFD